MQNEHKRCAIYSRVSTLMQVDKDSLPLQREDLTNYAKYALGIEDITVFEDPGYSAKNTDRPGYQAMMAKLRSGEYTHVLVWKIDRISRNLIDFATMYTEFKKLGITFISKNEQFDTSTAMGEAMLKIILVFAELERNMTSERVSAVMFSRAATGKFNGGSVPLGYIYDKKSKSYSIDEQRARTVKLIFNEYIKSKSLTDTVRYLNEHNITTRNGNKWSADTVAKILKNPSYIGSLRYNQKHNNGSIHGNKKKPVSELIIYPDHHEPIIDVEQFMLCNQTLKENFENKSNAVKKKGNKHVNMFAGLLKCGNCGSNLSSNKDRIRLNKNWTPSLYVCSKKYRFGGCENKYVSDLYIGEFLINYISNIINAKNIVTPKTTGVYLEKKLLKGIDGVRIEKNSLKRILQVMQENFSPIEYEKEAENSKDESEKDILLSEKSRYIKAMERLKKLYLYGDDMISEKDFLIEKEKITQSIKDIDDKLEVIEKGLSESYEISDEEFIDAASYFILTNELQNKKFINFDSLVSLTSESQIRNFYISVIKNICISNGKITSILFKNGVEHRFLYKDQEEEKP